MKLPELKELLTQELVDRLTAERDALAAQVERLRESINSVRSANHDVGFGQRSLQSAKAERLAWMRLNAAIAATPEQCLTKIKAQAIQRFATFIDDTGELSIHDAVFVINQSEQNANQLRQTKE
jgi:hypothetical protein